MQKILNHMLKVIYRYVLWGFIPAKYKKERELRGMNPEVRVQMQNAEKYILSHLNEYDENSTIKFIKRNGLLWVFNDNFNRDYYVRKYNFDICWDADYAGYYVIYKGFRMYMKQSMTEKEVKEYFVNLMMEQDKRSPHYYDTKDMIDDKTVIVDCGSAEGFFTLAHIRVAKKVIMVECDEAWCVALRRSLQFSGYESKVELVQCYIDNHLDDKHRTLYDIITSQGLCDENMLIKMDLEGAEVAALEGLRPLKNKQNLRMLITVYHNVGDEEKVRQALAELGKTEIEVSKGYIFFALYSKRLILG